MEHPKLLGGLCLGVVVALGPLATPSLEGGEKPAPPEKSEPAGKPRGVTLEAWGRLGAAIKGSEAFHELASYGLDAKGRKTTEKILVEIAEKTEVYADVLIRLEDLKPGEELWIFGKAVEREVVGKRGGGAGGRARGTDRQIQAARALLAGDALAVNENRTDPKDPGFKWLKATVTESAAGLRVRHANEEYRVTLEKDAPILRRSECERKLLKSGAYVHAVGEKTDPPESAAKPKSASKLAVRCRKVTILDPRYVATAYALILR